jgi:hypothetical protein
MNQFITKFICKSYYLCHTIVGRAYTYGAIYINSIEYKEYYQTLCNLLDLDYDNGIMLTHHQRLDKEKKWRKKYFK